jgi:hypothetical protein
MFFINPFIYAGGGDFESIATVTVGSGGASSIEFTSIPGTYQHLHIRAICRLERTDNSSFGLATTFNSDTGSNYAYHRLYGTGSAAVAAATTSTTSGLTGNVPADGTTASVYAGLVIDILDYASTSKTKTVRSFNGHDLNGSGLVLIDSMLWNSTSAITSIQFKDGGGPSQDIKQHSMFALYGVKAP